MEHERKVSGIRSSQAWLAGDYGLGVRDIWKWFARGLLGLVAMTAVSVAFSPMTLTDGLMWLLVGLAIGLVALAVRVALHTRAGPAVEP